MDASTPPTTPAAKIPLLINRNFGLLWSGEAISLLGDFAFDTTLVLWIATRIAAGQTWAPLAVSGVLLAASIPMVLIGSAAGVFVDRWDKRRTMLWMDGIRAVLIVALLATVTVIVPATHLSIGLELGVIYAVVFLVSAASQFFAPARITLIGDIVAQPLQARASGLGQATVPIATIVGPPLAAPLFFALGPAWALGVNALSFAVSFGAILAIRAPRHVRAAHTRSDFRGEFMDGLRFYAHNRVLMSLLGAGVLVMLGAGSINALDVFFVIQNLHAAPALYGVVGAAMGGGILVGAIGAGVFAERIGLTRTFWMSTIAAALAIIAYSRMTAVLPALILLFFAGVPIAALNVVVQPLILLVTPREFVGRITSVLMPAVSVASLVSMAAAGFLVSTVLHGFRASLLGVTFGPVDTVFTIAGLLALAGGVFAWLMMGESPVIEATLAA